MERKVTAKILMKTFFCCSLLLFSDKELAVYLNSINVQYGIFKIQTTTNHTIRNDQNSGADLPDHIIDFGLRI